MENLIQLEILSQSNNINVSVSENKSLDVNLLANLVPTGISASEYIENTDFELIFLTSII